MIGWLICKLWSHDWRTISVKEVSSRGWGYAIISVSECRRCGKMAERSKMVDPGESLKS